VRCFDQFSTLESVKREKFVVLPGTVEDSISEEVEGMRRAGALLAILLLVGYTVRSAALPTLNTRGTAAIDRMFQAAVDKGEVPGVVAAVTNKNRIVYLEAFGKQDVAKGVAMSTDTVFRIASMTKPITSVGVMMLYEQGKLRLDDPVSSYLPAYKGREVIATFNEKDATYTTRPANGEMTIRHLLTHTSGLSYPFTSPTVLAIQTKTGKDPRELPLLFDPGTRWNYSPATGVLGDIVEKLAGQTLEDFDRAKIFRPLGMVDTSYLLPSEKATRLATVHQRAATGLTENANPPTYTPTPRGDGGLLYEGSWHGARLLKPETVRLMTSNQIGSVVVEQMPAAMPQRSDAFPFGAGEDKFGLGFQITVTDGRTTHERAAGSYTWAGINNTHFWVDPKNGIGVVILTQVLPFYNATSMDVMKRFEKLIYEYLQ
jgi:CubicO group peptidase (beta-lactamase class C family)